MSRSRNSTASDAPHASSSGPRSFTRGSPSRPDPAASSSRFADRYDARKMTMKIFAELRRLEREPADSTHSRAPLISRPDPGDHRQEQQDHADQPDRVGVRVELPVVADQQQHDGEHPESDQEPDRLLCARPRAGRR